MWTDDQAAGVEPDEPEDEPDDELFAPDVLTSSPCFGGLPDTVCGAGSEPEPELEPESEPESEDDEPESDFESAEAATPLLPRLSVR